MSLLWQVLGLIFVAELGDKTQFLMIAMSRQYSLGSILAGVGGAILLLNAMAVGLGVLLGGVLPVAFIGIVAGVAFLLFAYASLGGEREDERDSGKRAGKGGAWTVFGAFFLAELGDKTQLTVLALAAEAGKGDLDLKKGIFVLFGASFGLFLADLLGLLVGFCMKKAIPSAIFSWLSVSIFAIFGVIKLLDGCERALAALPSAKPLSIGITVAAGILFVAAALGRLRKEGLREYTKSHDEKF